MKILHIVGTRPNFMKIAPIMAAFSAWNASRRTSDMKMKFEQRLIHTGQHYDPEMSKVFFDELALPVPDVYLDVRSGSHAGQTARLMMALEPRVLEERPDLVIVVGDVNSTMAAALVAVKLGIPVAHVESGLRSGDREMPEEVNRLVTDRISRLLFTTSASAQRQLQMEDVQDEWIHFVGNTMIDCLEATLPIARARSKCSTLSLLPGEFALVTLHRPSNVDDGEQRARMMRALTGVADRIPVVFPVHARTRARMSLEGQDRMLNDHPGVHLLPPLGYIDFLSLMRDARFVMTDSGGIQAETCVVGTPCITVRSSTEWQETVEAGANVLVDPLDEPAILLAAKRVLAKRTRNEGHRPELWDGHAAERIVTAIAAWASRRD